MSPSADPATDPHAIEVRLTLPARPSFARVARLAVTGLATRNGFTYDDVEDLRIAVGELFAVLRLPDGVVEAISLRCRVGDDHLEVLGSKRPSGPLEPVGDLTREILAAVVDEVDLDERAGTIRVAKRLVE